MNDLVSIVIATHKPNKSYLEKQLRSLNDQTYRRIEIIIRDDSNDNGEYERIDFIVKKTITKFGYRMLRNERNLGSNKTFELLTNDSAGSYIAYCDQDDIWLNNKIYTLLESIKGEKALLTYSDVFLMDESDRVFSSSLKSKRKRIKFVQGDFKWRHFIRRNCVIGSTMLIDSRVAKQAVPFPDRDIYIHDQWLALHASMKGKIVFINKPLIKYRIHKNNQIGLLKMPDIFNKGAYVEKRLELEKRRYSYLIKQFNREDIVRKHAIRMLQLAECRTIFINNCSLSNLIKIKNLFFLDWALFFFESLLGILSQRESEKLISMLKKTKL